MTTYKFKTNINCGSCVRAVSPLLNKLPNLDQWEVDTDTDDKILSASGEGLTPEAVMNAISKVGFKATPMN